MWLSSPPPFGWFETAPNTSGGAEVAGYLYTLVGSCMLQGIDPHEYLVDILTRLPDYPATRVGDLTPKAWRLAKNSHTAAVD